MKHSIRTLLTLTAMLCLLVSCLTINAFATVEITSGPCGDNVTWELEGTTLYVRGTGAMWDMEYDQFNPYHGSLVNILAYEADKIVISEGITYIGSRAFYIAGYWLTDEPYRVKEIIIPSGVTAIGEGAFCGCTGLTSITLPDGITTIPSSAFAGCYNLESVTIPDTVTTIERSAFSGCQSLSEITLPDSITSIGDHAFNDCKKLTSITFPASITSFGEYLFCDEYSSNNTLTSITFAEGFTELSGRSFSGLSALTTLNLPSTLTKINAFGGLRSLTELTIPDSVTYLSGFSGCTGLTELNIPDSVTHLSGFSNCTGLTELNIPDSVTEIYEFKGCTGLKRITLPNSVTILDAFDDCTGLTEITIPDSVTYLSGFCGCTGLKELNIPDSVTTIGDNSSSDNVILSDNLAFAKCTGLTKVTIAGSVVSIGNWAFSDCTNLEEITIPVSVVSVGNSSFKHCSENTVVNYQCGTEKQWIELVAANNFLLNAQVKIVHEWEEIEATDPTCTKDGNTAGKVCKLCSFGDPTPEAIPAIGHAFDPYEGSCTNCGEPDPAFVSNPFTDVSETDWFYKPVMWAKLNNVTGGTSPTTFSPDMGCTRAQVVTFLWAANGKPDPMSMYNPFTDVSDEAWYVKPVLWAVENGITGGTSATTFSPDATCTRAQIVTFLYAAQGKPNVDTENNPFTDVADTDWYVKPVLWAAENDVTGGIGNNQFGPNNTCTRGQVVTFLFKVYENK